MAFKSFKVVLAISYFPVCLLELATISYVDSLSSLLESQGGVSNFLVPLLCIYLELATFSYLDSVLGHLE